MTCYVCGKPATQGILGVGAYCSEEHMKELENLYNKQLDELAQEPLDVMPDLIDVEEFVRISMKIAVHAIRSMSDPVRQRMAQQSPAMLDPVCMAMEIRAMLFAHIPSGFYTISEAEGPERMFARQVAKFEHRIPRNVILEAMQKLEFI